MSHHHPHDEQHQAAQQQQKKKRKSRGWLAFFAVLALLVAVAVTLPIVYNLGQQLRPEKLAQAADRWNQLGPDDYDLTFSVQYDREPQAERHVVLVRGGRIVYASCEGELRHLAPPLAALAGLPLQGGMTTAQPQRQQQQEVVDVPGIFAHIERLMRLRESSDRQMFLVAVFDPENGYPRRFIWRIRGTSQREEWNVRVWPAGKLKG